MLPFLFTRGIVYLSISDALKYIYQNEAICTPFESSFDSQK